MREEGVAGQDGHGLSEDLVARRSTPAEVVVVHGREVVVDEGVGMDQLEGARGRHHVRHVAAGGLGRRDDQDGPEPLPARKHAVAHRLVDHGGLRDGGRQEALEGEVDRAPPGGEIGVEIEARARAHA